MDRLARPLLVMDFETTGLRPETSYPIQLGVLLVKENLEIDMDWRLGWNIRLPRSALPVVFTKAFWAAKRVHGKTVREMFSPESGEGYVAASIGQVVSDLDLIKRLVPNIQ